MNRQQAIEDLFLCMVTLKHIKYTANFLGAEDLTRLSLSLSEIETLNKTLEKDEWIETLKKDAASLGRYDPRLQ